MSNKENKGPNGKISKGYFKEEVKPNHPLTYKKMDVLNNVGGGQTKIIVRDHFMSRLPKVQASGHTGC